MRISDWSSDVCSSDLRRLGIVVDGTATVEAPKIGLIPKALDDDGRALSHRVEKGALRLGAVILPRHRWCVPFEPTTKLRRERTQHDPPLTIRSGGTETRRAGNRWLSRCRPRWSRNH